MSTFIREFGQSIAHAPQMVWRWATECWELIKDPAVSVSILMGVSCVMYLSWVIARG